MVNYTVCTQQAVPALYAMPFAGYRRLAHGVFRHADNCVITPIYQPATFQQVEILQHPDVHGIWEAGKLNLHLRKVAASVCEQQHHKCSCA